MGGQDETAAVVELLRKSPALASLRALRRENRGSSRDEARSRSRLALVPKTGHSGVPLSARTVGSVRYRDILHTVFRRFAGELVVKGKLLNQDELVVRQFTRKRSRAGSIAAHRLQRRHEDEDGDGDEEDGEGSAIVVTVPDSLVRFVVRCEGAPSKCVGHDDVMADVRSPQLRSFVSSPREAMPTVCYRPDDASMWEARAVTALDQLEHVLGFAVNAFRINNRKARGFESVSVEGDHGKDGKTLDDGEEEEEEAACINDRISRHQSFSDLSGMQRMMHALCPQDSVSASFLIGSANTEAMQGPITSNHPMSYISLGQAQKAAWSNERLQRGKELVGKARVKEAVIEFTSAIKLDEGNAAAFKLRGIAHLELRHYKDAISDLKRALELHPGLDRVAEYLLRAKGKLSHSKHVEQAVPVFQPRSRLEEQSSATRSRRSVGSDASFRDDAASVRSVTSSRDGQRGQSVGQDRLQQLLERDDEIHRRERKKRHRESDSGGRGRHHADEDDDDKDADDSDASRESRRHRRHKSSKKTSKKSSKKKKASKSKKSKRDHSRDRRSRSRDRRSRRSSDSSSGSDSSLSDASSHRRRERRMRQAKDGGRTTSEPETFIHPILQRQPHRLWN